MYVCTLMQCALSCMHVCHVSLCVQEACWPLCCSSLQSLSGRLSLGSPSRCSLRSGDTNTPAHLHAMIFRRDLSFVYAYTFCFFLFSHFLLFIYFTVLLVACYCLLPVFSLTLPNSTFLFLFKPHSSLPLLPHSS